MTQLLIILAFALLCGLWGAIQLASARQARSCGSCGPKDTEQQSECTRSSCQSRAE